MKRISSLFSALLVFIIIGTGAAQAQSRFGLNAGYAKGNSTFDIVAKEFPNTKLKLYVNDKNPIQTTSNKKGWATFRKVKLTQSGKLSFTQVLKNGGKQHEHALNYVRNYTVSHNKVSFSKPKPKTTVTTAQPAAPVVTPAPVATPAPAPTPVASSDSDLSNNNYYTNSAGNTVHSPAASTDDTIPAGATAQCRDGSYSFSQHRSGTCSHHGGVASWL